MKLHVIGWAGLTHSYSVSLELYIKSLIETYDIDLYFTPYPYYFPQWKQSLPSIFDTCKKATDNDTFDITIKYVYPYDLTSDPKAKITIVFMTCEFNFVHDSIDAYNISDDVFIMTPSEYSKRGIVNTGFPEDKVFVINHICEVVNIKMTKQELRNKYKIPVNAFVYFHNSALTANKNLQMIIINFELIYRNTKNVVLLIKGNDSMYNSCGKINEFLREIQKQIRITCFENIIYIGKDLSDAKIGELYILSDYYVSASSAEGFNMPILEAACYGLQSICSNYSPPCEFSPDTHFINSKIVEIDNKTNVNGNEKVKTMILPDMNNLFELMNFARFNINHFDKQKYIEKFSKKTIGKLLWDQLNKLLKLEINVPEIIILDNSNIPVDGIIKNVRYWCGNIKIYIITNKNKQSNGNDIYFNISFELTPENATENIKMLCEKYNIKKYVCLSSNIILMIDPRVPLFSKLLNSLSTENYTQREYKWICIRKTIKSLYCKNGDKFDKVGYLLNNNNSNYIDYVMVRECNNPQVINTLRNVEIAFLSKNEVDKYDNIMRNAPQTFIIDTTQKINGNYKDFDRFTKIFIYPRMINYFFARMYKYLQHDITIYSISNSDWNKQKIKEHDINNHILDFITVDY